MIDIRIHVIPTANDDGSKEVTETAAHIKENFKLVNDLYKQAGVSFIFDPESDFDSIRRSTLLNLDMLEQPQNVIDSWPLDKDYDFKEYQKPLTDEKERVAKEYPGKLVIFVGNEGTYYLDDNKKWVFGPCRDWCPGAFVRMADYQHWGKFAHEISHYLQFGDHNTIQGNVGGYCEPYNNITEEQVKTIHKALEPGGYQYHITSPRVLYDAICEPSNPGQTRAIGWNQTDFAKRFDDEIAEGKHVVHMQAYIGSDGQVGRDGVWESGDKNQTRAIG
ncbi:MAG: hypothetical protein M0Q47_13325, partial [Methanothrix sp.]|uniref:hypothetical protein n=1 Tax=Methanothrix sp. TaxID=90426 RepID=UPI0025E87F72